MGRYDENTNTMTHGFKFLENAIYEKLFNLTPLHKLNAVEEASKGKTSNQIQAIFYQSAIHPMIMFGSPGVGKTSIIESAIDRINSDILSAKENGCLMDGTPVPSDIVDELTYDCEVKDYDPNTGFWVKTGKDKRLIQFESKIYTLAGMDRTEFEPIPLMNLKDGTLQLKTPDIIPQEDKHGRYGIVFFDEITSVDTGLIQPFMSASDGRRMLGQAKLPKYWLVIAAGNKGFVNDEGSFSQAAMTRGTVYNIEVEPEDANCLFALENSNTGNPYFHSKVKAFLTLFPAYIAEADTQGDEKQKKDEVKANPRTWSALSSIFYEWDLNKKYANESWVSKVCTNIKSIECITVMNTIGAYIGQKFRLFLEATQDESNQYDPDKIMAGKERKCEFGALKAKGSSKNLSGDTGAMGIGEVTISDYQAAATMLVSSLIEKLTIKFKHFEDIADKTTVGEHPEYWFDMGLPKDKDDEAYIAWKDVFMSFVHTFAWLANSDVKLELVCRFVAIAQQQLTTKNRWMYLSQAIFQGGFEYLFAPEDVKEAELVDKISKTFVDVCNAFQNFTSDNNMSVAVTEDLIQQMGNSI